MSYYICVCSLLFQDNELLRDIFGLGAPIPIGAMPSQKVSKFERVSSVLSRNVVIYQGHMCNKIYVLQVKLLQNYLSNALMRILIGMLNHIGWKLILMFFLSHFSICLMQLRLRPGPKLVPSTEISDK